MAEVVVIVNEAAGLGGHAGPGRRAAEQLAAAGRAVELCVAADGAELVGMAQKAVAGGARLVVAAGGDGTVNAVAGVLAGTEVALGVLPFGTMNHFAKDLGLPLAPAAAMDVLLNGCVARVDVGEVNGHVFVNNSSLGLYPDVVMARRWHQKRGWRKWPAFLLAALGVLRRFPLLNVRLDGSWTRTPFVFVGNNRYGGDGRRAHLDAGTLCLVTARVTSRLGLLRTLAPRRALDEACVPEACIGSRKTRLRVATDGEVVALAPPLRYRVRPGALRVMVEG